MFEMIERWRETDVVIPMYKAFIVQATFPISSNCSDVNTQEEQKVDLSRHKPWLSLAA